jgi:peptidoglycan/LPS O-acetylase OafA/YrhL
VQDSTPDAPPTKRVLTEIQALRALAVLAVVLFHLAPNRISGGYVGVDAFFVISGFLITSHLFKEVARSGKIALSQFWARRIRRLLPAAFLVMAVSAVLVLKMLPTIFWAQMLNEIAASSLYIQNWLLARNAVDYFAEENIASPVQHYWSLSVEEQFYVMWPLLITAAVALRNRTIAAKRQAVIAIAILVFVLSLIYSVHIANVAQSFGYFSTFSHAWEFAIGALLAMLQPSLDRFAGRFQPLRAALAWIGYAVVIFAALTITEHTRFPGFTALLPVSGVLAVIAAGRSNASWSPAKLVELRPIQYVGDISYSLYLWHWPPIVVLPFLTGHPLTSIEKIGIFVGAIALSAITKTWVEDRFRFGPLAKLSPRRTFTVTALVSALMVSVCDYPLTILDQQVARGTSSVEAALKTRNCFAANAMLEKNCGRGFAVDPIFGPIFAKNDDVPEWLARNVDPAQVDTEHCPLVAPGVEQCTYGDPKATTTILLVGDSHARMLLPPILEIAKSKGWKTRMIWHSSCRPALPLYTSTVSADNEPDCITWKNNMVTFVAAASDVNVIVTTGAGSRLGHEMNARDLADASAAFAKTWDTWASSGKPIVVIQDVPLAQGRDPLECIAEHEGDRDPCTQLRSVVAPIDPIDMAAQYPHSNRVHFVDPTPAFCDETTCHFVVGGVITHRDFGHLTTTFARSLGPLIEKTILVALD